MPRCVAAWILGLGWLPLLSGCGSNPYAPGPIAAGVVRVDASLADASGTSAGTLRTTTADGIRVWLLEGGREVDSTLTMRGAYAFGLRKGHAYRTRVRVTPAFADSLPAFTPTGDVTTYLDTLVLEPRGDLTSRPNPFTSQVMLQFQLATLAHVELHVYDLSAAQVRTLASRDFAAGTYQVSWDGLDDAGRAVRNGMYWALLAIPGETRAALVIKQP